MLRKFYLLSILSLLSLYCAGQEQITDFKNAKDVSSNQPYYQSKLNGKIFFTSFTPESGTELWVSDGTTENTKLLKDFSPGSNGSYFVDFTEYKGHLYFLTGGHEVWKTDGSVAGTSKVYRSDSLMNLYAVKDKLLLTFRGEGLGRIQQFPLAWLNDAGKVEFWEKNATAFKVLDNSLYYNTYDSLAKSSELRVFDTNTHLLYQKNGDYILDIKIEKYKGYEYVSLIEYNQKPALIVVNAEDRSMQGTFYPWTYGLIPICLKDSTGALFLIKDDYYDEGTKDLQIYKVTNGNSWQEIAKLTPSKMYEGFENGYGSFYPATFYIQGNNISFLTVYGIETVSATKLNVFNFKTNKSRVSSKLPKEITQRELNVKAKSEDVYEISNGGIKVTYDLAKDQTVSLETIPQIASPIITGKNKFDVSDNVYLLSGNEKLPLLNLKDTFKQSALTYRDTLNGKIIFWTFSEELNKGQLWTSDGNKTQEIFQHDGYADSYTLSTKIGRMKNSLVFTSVSDKAVKIFKTDGTTDGTKELYSYPVGETTYLTESFFNDREALFEIYSDGKKFQVITDFEQTREIDITGFVYHKVLKTSNSFYFLDETPKNGISYTALYKIENGLLKPIDLGFKGNEQYHQVYKDKIYYTGRASGANSFSDIFYLDEKNERHKAYTGTVSTFYFLGNHMLVNAHDPYANTDMTTLLKPASGKVVYKFEGNSLSAVIFGSSSVLLSLYKLVVISDTDVREFQFDNGIDQFLKAPTGFVFRGRSSEGVYYYFYNTRKKEMIRIVEGTGLYLDFNEKNETLAFIGEEPNTTRRYIWNTSDQKLIKLGEDLRITGQLNGKLFTVVKVDKYAEPMVYALDGENFTRKYSFTNTFINDVMMAGNSNYFPIYRSGTGSELTRLEKDSIFHFPEIVKGPEGIDLQQVFHFNERVYAAGFTSSKGLQVWKMGEVVEEKKPVEEPETEIPDSRVTPGLPDGVTFLPDEIDINTYPNPVTNELNIDVRTPGTMQILNKEGLEVIKTAAGKKSIVDLKDLAPGQYIIIFTNPKTKLVKKIIKL